METPDSYYISFTVTPQNKEIFKTLFGETRYSESEWRGHSDAHSKHIVVQKRHSLNEQGAHAHRGHL
jgi:hypothetical protein